MGPRTRSGAAQSLGPSQRDPATNHGQDAVVSSTEPRSRKPSQKQAAANAAKEAANAGRKDNRGRPTRKRTPADASGDDDDEPGSLDGTASPPKKLKTQKSKPETNTNRKTKPKGKGAAIPRFPGLGTQTAAVPSGSSISIEAADGIAANILQADAQADVEAPAHIRVGSTQAQTSAVRPVMKLPNSAGDDHLNDGSIPDESSSPSPSPEVDTLLEPDQPSVGREAPAPDNSEVEPIQTGSEVETPNDNPWASANTGHEAHQEGPALKKADLATDAPAPASEQQKQQQAPSTVGANHRSARMKIRAIRKARVKTSMRRRRELKPITCTFFWDNSVTIRIDIDIDTLQAAVDDFEKPMDVLRTSIMNMLTNAMYRTDGLEVSDVRIVWPFHGDWAAPDGMRGLRRETRDADDHCLIGLLEIALEASPHAYLEFRLESNVENNREIMKLEYQSRRSHSSEGSEPSELYSLPSEAPEEVERHARADSPRDGPDDGIAAGTQKLLESKSSRQPARSQGVQHGRATRLATEELSDYRDEPSPGTGPFAQAIQKHSDKNDALHRTFGDGTAGLAGGDQGFLVGSQDPIIAPGLSLDRVGLPKPVEATQARQLINPTKKSTSRLNEVLSTDGAERDTHTAETSKYNSKAFQPRDHDSLTGSLAQESDSDGESNGSHALRLPEFD